MIKYCMQSMSGVQNEHIENKVQGPKHKIHDNFKVNIRLYFGCLFVSFLFHGYYNNYKITTQSF